MALNQIKFLGIDRHVRELVRRSSTTREEEAIALGDLCFIGASQAKRHVVEALTSFQLSAVAHC